MRCRPTVAKAGLRRGLGPKALTEERDRSQTSIRMSKKFVAALKASPSVWPGSRSLSHPCTPGHWKSRNFSKHFLHPLDSQCVKVHENSETSRGAMSNDLLKVRWGFRETPNSGSQKQSTKKKRFLLKLRKKSFLYFCTLNTTFLLFQQNLPI
jgi:hypothetical protein